MRKNEPLPIALLLIKTSVSIGLFYKRVMGALGYYIKLFFVLIHDSGE
jgi:hypothetical protein